jgi:hypothetical protein
MERNEGGEVVKRIERKEAVSILLINSSSLPLSLLLHPVPNYLLHILFSSVLILLLRGRRES